VELLAKAKPVWQIEFDLIGFLWTTMYN